MKQIKKMVYSLLLSVCCATMFTACSEEEGVVDAKDLELSKEELVFLAEPGESQSVTFVANADWKASSEQGWILIETPVGKKGESTVTVKVKKNTEKVSRQGNVVITEPSTGKMASFKVKQEAEGVNFIVDKREGHFIVDEENKTISEKFTVKANYEYEIKIVDADWINYSIGENDEIVFSAVGNINKPLPTDSKTVKVDFVSTQEGIATESVTILWDGYTPYIKFYSDEECTKEISNVEFDQFGNDVTTYVKSNIPWTTSLKGDNFASFITYDDSKDLTITERLPYVIETKAKLFVKYDILKLSSKNQKLFFDFINSDNTFTLEYNKKGYNIYLDNTQFRTLVDPNNPDLGGVPTFSATKIDGAPEANNGLNFNFEVLSKNEIAPIILIKKDSQWVIVNKEAKCFRIGEIEKYNESLNIYKYKLSVEDRTNNPGSKLEFKLYLAENNNISDLYKEYFTSGDIIKEDKKDFITGGMNFEQSGNLDLIDFISEDITKIGKYHNITPENKVVELRYELKDMSMEDYMNIKFYSNITLSEDKQFVISGDKIDYTDPSKDTDGIISSFFKFDGEMPILTPLQVTIDKYDKIDSEKGYTVYMGYWLQSSNTSNDIIQYLGKFTIKYKSASSTTK